MSLPEGWAWTTIGETGQYVNGFAFKPSHRTSQGKPIVRIQNLTDVERPMHRTSAEVPPAFHVSPGDILVSWSATLDAFIWNREEALLNQHIFRVVPDDQIIDHRLLYHWLRQAIADLRESAHMHGSTMAHINREPFLSHRLPLPPRQAQARIADRLDELFSDMDAAEAEMRSGKRKLALHRQSLMKSAVDGSLTAAWRDANPGDPASTEYLCGTARPASLPKSWSWISVDSLPAMSMANGRSVRTADDGAKVLRLTAVRDGKIDLGQTKVGAWSAEDAAPFAVREGDLLIVRGNGSLSLVGRAGVVPPVNELVAYPDTLIRLRVADDTVHPGWLACVWDSAIVRDHLERKARTAAGIYKIAQPDIASVCIPVPPLAEQDAALRLFNERLEQLVATHESVAMVQRLATAQRQNILRAAFSGRLVPQDPNDEPASVLLDRIRRQRDATPQPARRQRRAGTPVAP